LRWRACTDDRFDIQTKPDAAVSAFVRRAVAVTTSSIFRCDAAWRYRVAQAAVNRLAIGDRNQAERASPALVELVLVVGDRHHRFFRRPQDHRPSVLDIHRQRYGLGAFAVVAVAVTHIAVIIGDQVGIEIAQVDDALIAVIIIDNINAIVVSIVIVLCIVLFRCWEW